MELRAEGSGPTSVGDVERWASLIGGGMLAIYGMTRGSRTGALLALMGGGLAYRGISGHTPLIEGLHVRRPEDDAFDGDLDGARRRGIKVEETIVIDRVVPEVYRAWRRLENLPRILRHVQSVLPIDGNRYHWTVRGPIGTVEWDAEVVDERENELIAWRSVEPSSLPNAGTVRFHAGPGGRGTELRVKLAYRPPTGPLGALMGRLFGVEPQRQLGDDLSRFKQTMETGGLETLDSMSGGRAW